MRRIIALFSALYMIACTDSLPAGTSQVFLDNASPATYVIREGSCELTGINIAGFPYRSVDDLNCDHLADSGTGVNGVTLSRIGLKDKHKNKLDALLESAHSQYLSRKEFLAD